MQPLSAFTRRGSRVTAIQFSVLTKSDGRVTFVHEDGHSSGLLHECGHKCINVMSYRRDKNGETGSSFNEQQHADMFQHVIYPLLLFGNKSINKETGALEAARVQNHGDDPQGDVKALLTKGIDNTHKEIHWTSWKINDE